VPVLLALFAVVLAAAATDHAAMYTGSSDQSIQCIDVEKQAVNATLSNAHRCGMRDSQRA